MMHLTTFTATTSNTNWTVRPRLDPPPPWQPPSAGDREPRRPAPVAPAGAVALEVAP